MFLGLHFPPGMMQRCEEALSIVHLHLSTLQGDGEMGGELVKSGLIVAGSDYQEIGLGARSQRVRVGHRDPQSWKPRLPPEMAHQRDKGLDLLLGRRGRQDDGGSPQVRKARERETR